MNESKELDNIRNVIFNQGGEKHQVFNLCAVMDIVGGYDQLMNLSLPTLNEVFNYLEYLNKEEKKLADKIKKK